jgi:hypothetical protein
MAMLRKPHIKAYGAGIRGHFTNVGNRVNNLEAEVSNDTINQGVKVVACLFEGQVSCLVD